MLTKRAFFLDEFPHSASLRRMLTQCPILYHEKGVLIIDKPAGVLSHPNPPRFEFSDKKKLSRAAFEGPYDYDQRVFETPDGRIWLIHRLDQETSGVLLAADNAETAHALRSAFETGAIEKYSTALISGLPQKPTGKWNDHVAVKRSSHQVRSAVVSGKPVNAQLEFTVKCVYPKPKLTLLHIRLLTGKTHQIRVQAAAHNYPIAGDEIYGHFALNRLLRKEIGLRRIFLHAHELRIQHPEPDLPVHVKSSLPEKLNECLRRMEPFRKVMKGSGSWG